MLPKEVINLIYSFDVSHRAKFKLCIKELIQRDYKKRVNSIILLLNYGPNYIIPKYFKRNINIYPILNIIRSNNI